MLPRHALRFALPVLAFLAPAALLTARSVIAQERAATPNPAPTAEGDTEAQAAPAAGPAGQGDPAGATPDVDPAEAARRARIFARVGEVSLTVGEIEDDINRRSPFARRPFTDRRRLVEHARLMFRGKLLAHAALERGYGERPAVRTLLDRHLVSLVVRRQVDAQNAPSSIPAERVAQYFEEHRDAFVRPEQRRASHILVRDRAEAVRIAQEAAGVDLRGFQRLAREHSLDTESKQRGGDLGFFSEEGRSRRADASIDAAIAAAAFALTRENPVSSTPVEVTAGEDTHYSVVRLTAVNAGSNPTLADVEPVVRRRLAREQRDTGYRRYLDSLRERHQVARGSTEVIRSIDLPPPPMPRDPHGRHGTEPEGADEMAAPSPMAPAEAMSAGMAPSE